MNLKNEDNIFKLGAILLVVTLIAGLILGIVFNVTKEPIAKQEKINNDKAMKELFKEADTFDKSNVALKEDGKITEVNEAKKGSEVVGYAIKAETKGYAGTITLMAGVSVEGKITGIQIISQSETAGLGQNCTKDFFKDNFKDKDIKKPLNVVKSNPSPENEVLAISGATITSKAVTNAVNDIVTFYKENLEGGK
ncbi:electron transport complex protein RnfG [Hathewaya proteolytica DSM 3090]|uniref:Ion-translocating oxidoreductase complex subunit G n=1 Tax=Hathewaya proteolytica DSM 3090 TaxID=1121331 RepID=A0A1M6SHS8_9CLOT|nr:RnfABCDGE type electron transport complex subunit G [Hathewaya proteolytica]SHK44344.1 electron transport complex protein RnfG [Hathewaya proteolytica DSM 3090]